MSVSFHSLTQLKSKHMKIIIKLIQTALTLSLCLGASLAVYVAISFAFEEEKLLVGLFYYLHAVASFFIGVNTTRLNNWFWDLKNTK